MQPNFYPLCTLINAAGASNTDPLSNLHQLVGLRPSILYNIDVLKRYTTFDWEGGRDPQDAAYLDLPSPHHTRNKSAGALP